jgi:hypothetical protein
MASEGPSIHDLLPTPASTSPMSPNETKVHNSMTEKPTASHALAMASQEAEEKGAAQRDYVEEDVANLGWNEPESHIASPLVGGLSNEELWLLVRRFNKVRSALYLLACRTRSGLLGRY